MKSNTEKLDHEFKLLSFQTYMHNPDSCNREVTNGMQSLF